MGKLGIGFVMGLLGIVGFQKYRLHYWSKRNTNDLVEMAGLVADSEDP